MSCLTSVDHLTHLLGCLHPTVNPETADAGSQHRDLCKGLPEQRKTMGDPFPPAFLSEGA